MWHKAKLYSFCHNRNLPLAIGETMAAIVRTMQLFCQSLCKTSNLMKTGVSHCAAVWNFLCCHVAVTGGKKLETFRVEIHAMMTLWQVYTNTRWQHVTAC